MMRWLTVVLLIIPVPVFAGEECVQLGGTCRETCLPEEAIEVGAFLDCSDKQECCMKTEPASAQERTITPDTEKEDAGTAHRE